MKSGRQRRAEILERRRRLERIGERTSVEPWLMPVPCGELPADLTKLLHDTTYEPRPRNKTANVVAIGVRPCGSDPRA
jgi:hypothetical protein